MLTPDPVKSLAPPSAPLAQDRSIQGYFMPKKQLPVTKTVTCREDTNKQTFKQTDRGSG